MRPIPSAVATLVLLTDQVATAATPVTDPVDAPLAIPTEASPRWRLGGHANISAGTAGASGGLFGLGLGAKHSLSSRFDLQIRAYVTYAPKDWILQSSAAKFPLYAGYLTVDDRVHVLAEATARLRTWAPLFVGMGIQGGVRLVNYSEIQGEWPGSFWEKPGTDTQPILRALVEVGADFGPSDMFEVGARFAGGAALGEQRVQRSIPGAWGDAELGLTAGVLLPL